MEFLPEKSDEFEACVKNITQRIANFEGCYAVRILRESDEGNVFFSYSYWRSKEDLEKYRKSDLFREIWPKTKAMFSSRAIAWTTEVVDSKINENEGDNFRF